MHRRALKALLAAYRERWPQESATVARFDAFVDSHLDCFHRSCWVGHITSSAWVVDTTGERVVLTHHAKLGRWLQPGGHSDGDPDKGVQGELIGGCVSPTGKPPHSDLPAPPTR